MSALAFALDLANNTLNFAVDMAGSAVSLAVDFVTFVAKMFGYDFSNSDNSQYLGDV